VVVVGEWVRLCGLREVIVCLTVKRSSMESLLYCTVSVPARRVYSWEPSGSLVGGSSDQRYVMLPLLHALPGPSAKFRGWDNRVLLEAEQAARAPG